MSPPPSGIRAEARAGRRCRATVARMADAPAGRPISLRIDPDLLAAVDADLDGRTRTAWIEGAIRHRLAQSIDLPVTTGGWVVPPVRKVPRGRTVPGLARSTADRLRRPR